MRLYFPACGPALSFNMRVIFQAWQLNVMEISILIEPVRCTCCTTVSATTVICHDATGIMHESSDDWSGSHQLI